MDCKRISDHQSERHTFAREATHDTALGYPFWKFCLTKGKQNLPRKWERNVITCKSDLKPVHRGLSCATFDFASIWTEPRAIVYNYI